MPHLQVCYIDEIANYLWFFTDLFVLSLSRKFYYLHFLGDFHKILLVNKEIVVVDVY